MSPIPRGRRRCASTRTATHAATPGRTPTPTPEDDHWKKFGITQPAVSQHLRVLRESGFVSVRPEGTRRLYSVEPAPLREVDLWLDRFRAHWEERLDALATEVARGKRERRGGSARGATGQE